MLPPWFFQQASFIPNSTSMLLSQAASTQHNVSSTSITDLYLLYLDYRFIFSLFCMGNQEFLFQPRIRFWLRVFLILVENVPNFFFKGKKKYFFKLLYIIFFSRSGCSWEHPGLNMAPPLLISWVLIIVYSLYWWISIVCCRFYSLNCDNVDVTYCY